MFTEILNVVQLLAYPTVAIVGFISLISGLVIFETLDGLQNDNAERDGGRLGNPLRRGSPRLAMKPMR